MGNNHSQTSPPILSSPPATALSDTQAFTENTQRHSIYVSRLCGITKPMLVLLGGRLLSGAILWEAWPALNPRCGVHPCSVLQALTSVDFSLPCVTWGAFHLLFRTAGMKCTNMHWLLSTLPFPLAETRPETSFKVQNLSDE